MNPYLRLKKEAERLDEQAENLTETVRIIKEMAKSHRRKCTHEDEKGRSTSSYYGHTGKRGHEVPVYICSICGQTF